MRKTSALLLAGTALCASIPARAQVADSDGGLDVIVVTAQKREQSVQDVPIAVTALGAEALEANRVVNVTDLSSLAPGVTVRTSAGGSRLPSFSIRGAVSYGVAPGSDKQVSIYLDGVYLSSPRGTIFDLPDVERIEVLRGPQGTLFGRNATAGAVSISTRNPDGEVGVRATATYGNLGQRRFALSVDTPQVGPLSAYFSFVHDERRGDIRNLAAGQVWDRTSSSLPRIANIERSPVWLGSKDSQSYFAAVKFESGDFETVYKFDRTKDTGSAEGTGLIGVNTSVPLLGNLINTLINTQTFEVPIASDGRRPKAVANQFVIPGQLEVEGHSLTSTYQASENLSFKNIFAYRKSFVFAASALDGLGSLTITPQAIQPFAILSAFSTVPGLGQAPPATQAAVIGQFAAGLVPFIGSPFALIATNPASSSKQYSDEFQANYDSDFVTAIAGAIWFHSTDRIGHTLQQNTLAFSPILGGVLPNTDIGENRNKATSLAAYAQLEIHATPQLDVVLGGRITKDKKSGSFTFGPTPASLTTVPFTYKKTKPNYSIGLNYKASEDILVYAKYSTAFVSGGSVATIEFAPETAKSWEGGVKAELLNRKLRANLAVYHASYKNYQSAQGSTGFEDFILAETGSQAIANGIGTFVVSSGGVKAKGFELDLTAAPTDGLTLGGGIGYSKTTFNNVNPALIANSGGAYLPTLRPDWTANAYAQYDTQPLVGDAYLSFRVDGAWQSDMTFAENPDRPMYKIAPTLLEEPAYLLVNGRVALRDIDLDGVKTQFAVWGKNLTNERAKTFVLNLSDIFGAANYIPARAYGVDLTIEF
jgi:iron complex outermembrane receptor protein